MKLPLLALLFVLGAVQSSRGQTDGGVASVNDIEMRYQIHGDGEPLVLLHGFMGNGATWSTILGDLDVLGDRYQLIIPDLRGHGGSTNPTGEFTLRQSGRDILALLDQLGIDRFKVIGMSGGGMTALHMATSQPDRVERMVLISATTHFPEQARAIMRGTTAETRTDAEWAQMRALHEHGDDQIRALWRISRGFADSRDDMAFTSAGLAGITAPTLVVHGDRDPLFPLEIGLALHDGIPTSWLWVVPDGGHLSIVAEGLTDQFVRTARAFLAGEWD